MKIAVISQNIRWKEFIIEKIDLPGYHVDSLNFDIDVNIVCSNGYDLIILDIEDAHKYNFALLVFKMRMVFGWSPYFIVVSSDMSIGRNQLVESIVSGSDDFIEESGDVNTILAKASSVKRRRYFETSNFEERINYQVSVRDQTVSVNSEPVNLNVKEFELFLLFYGNLDCVLDRKSIYSQIWPDAVRKKTRTLDTHVSRIRKRLRLDGSYGLKMKTIYRVGYMLESSNRQ